MIDGSRPDPRYQPSAPGGSPPGGRPSGLRPGTASSELFANLFDAAGHEAATAAHRPAGPPQQRSPAPPPVPVSFQDTGLGLMQVGDLILKQLYLQGNLLGVQIARNARLPFRVIEEALRMLKDEKCIEISSGDMIGPASYRFNLTEVGRRRAQEAFEQCRYVGPAPVPLSAYIEQCRKQAVTGTACRAESLSEAFGQLIIRPDLLEELGPAVCSGKSIFVYGPPGNGKTMIAKGLGRFLNTYGGEIYVPYAIDAEGSIITMFDPTIHQATDNAELLGTESLEQYVATFTDPSAVGRTDWDLRWRRIRRPVVITGGELTLEMLDLRYNRDSNFYTAPLHIKANGGVFLIDDFGRQIVSPRDLLNRWILPLEERVDYLTLATGKKFAIPFEQLIIFSTNLDPRELVDEAFLRRIRHKIQIGPPSRDLFVDIFQLCCRQRQIAFEPEAVDYLYEHYYEHGKPPRSSDPRDLLEIVQSICRFRNEPVQLSTRLIAEASQRYFCQV